jgi:hypothetical protein
MKKFQLKFKLKFQQPEQAGFRTPFGRAVSNLNEQTEHGAMWGFDKDGIYVDVYPDERPDKTYWPNLRERFLKLLRRWEKKGAIKLCETQS